MLPPVPHVNKNGFTLIEVMVAMMIMMVGMLALLQTVNISIAHNNSNKLRNDAVRIADERIGIELTKAFNSVASGTESVTIDNVQYSVVKNVSNLTTHSIATDRISGSKSLRVEISWNDSGKTKKHSLSTTIVEPAN
jgi:type IV pilus assembly protein PilV